jgi:hypothetical protein
MNKKVSFDNEKEREKLNFEMNSTKQEKQQNCNILL